MSVMAVPSTKHLRLAGTNSQAAGDLNQRIILHHIRVHGPVTKADLARMTGLTHPAVTNITRRLLDEGWIQAAGRRRGGRGQPGESLVVNPKGAYSLGLNIDRDHLTLVLVNFIGQVCARTSKEIAFPLPNQVAQFYRHNCPRLLKDAGVKPSQLTGLGVALPDDLGEVDLPGRPADYGIWAKTAIEDLLNEPLDLPIVVENDAAAAAIGETQFGFGQRFHSFFYLLLSYALGGGLVVGSVYDRGANGRSGEIGFMQVADTQAGTVQLQSIVSLAGLYSRLEVAGHKRQIPNERDAAAPTAPVVDAWLDECAMALVEPLLAVNCLINPEAILIGGRLPAMLVEQLAIRTNLLLRRRGSHAPIIAPVQRAALSEDAPSVGAAILPFSDLLVPASNTAPVHFEPDARRLYRED